MKCAADVRGRSYVCLKVLISYCSQQSVRGVGCGFGAFFSPFPVGSIANIPFKMEILFPAAPEPGGRWHCDLAGPVELAGLPDSCLK